MSETRVRFDPAADFRPTRAIDRLRRIPLGLVLSILVFVFVIGSRMVVAMLASPSTDLAPTLDVAAADLGGCTVTVEQATATTGAVQILTVESQARDARFALALVGPTPRVLVGRTDAAGRAVLTVPTGPMEGEGSGSITVQVRVAGADCSTTYTLNGR